MKPDPRSTTRRPVTQTSSARAAAFEAIRRVIEEGAYSTRVIPAVLNASRLDARDRAMATDLAYGTLRHLLPIDDVLEHAASRSLRRMSPGVRTALRLGVYQLLATATATHAAVGETVNLVTPRERGFVNAVLRRVARETTDGFPSVSGETDADISLRTGLQLWAVAELRETLSVDAQDEVEQAAGAFASQARLCVRAMGQQAGVEQVEIDLRAAGYEPRRSSLDPSCLLLDGAGDPRRLPGFAQGRLTIQDEASAVVVSTFLAPQEGERILDVAAAPGGKSCAIAEAVGERGAVVASDLHPARAALVRQAAERLGVHPLIVVQDGATPAVRGGFDRVLVDAPCSGIGSARRRPELLWRPSRADLPRLAATQLSLVVAAAGLLRPGGRLVYSVCTFPRIETDAVCDEAVRRVPELRPLSLPGPDGRGTAERHRLWPHLDGSDGMFIAAFERTS